MRSQRQISARAHPQVPPIVQQGVPITQVAQEAATQPASPDPESPDELPLDELLEEPPLDELPLDEPLDELPLDEPLEELPLDEPLEELDELVGVSAALKQAVWALHASDRQDVNASMVTSLYTFNDVQLLIASEEQVGAEAAACEQNEVRAAVGVMAAWALPSQVARAELDWPPSLGAISAHVAPVSHAVRLAA
jgi:hypothetical protein